MIMDYVKNVIKKMFVKFMNINPQIIYQTKNLCKECNRENTYPNWCKECNAKHFQQNFKKWTSGNVDIDQFIQEAQLSANDFDRVIEWIPYDRFNNIENIAEGGFSKVFKANWIDGNMWYWDDNNQNWKRYEPNKFVALKRLDNSNKITLE